MSKIEDLDRFGDFREIAMILTDRYEHHQAMLDSQFAEVRKEFPDTIMHSIIRHYNKLKQAGDDQDLRENILYDLASDCIQELVELRIITRGN